MHNVSCFLFHSDNLKLFLVLVAHTFLSICLQTRLDPLSDDWWDNKIWLLLLLKNISIPIFIWYYCIKWLKRLIVCPSKNQRLQTFHYGRDGDYRVTIFDAFFFRWKKSSNRSSYHFTDSDWEKYNNDSKKNSHLSNTGGPFSSLMINHLFMSGLSSPHKINTAHKLRSFLLGFPVFFF